MKIKIAREKCVGHGRCAAVAPNIYPLNDDGYIAVDSIDAPESLAKEALRGLRACPERIISIETTAGLDPQSPNARHAGQVK